MVVFEVVVCDDVEVIVLLFVLLFIEFVFVGVVFVVGVVIFELYMLLMCGNLVEDDLECEFVWLCWFGFMFVVVFGVLVFVGVGLGIVGFL